MLSKSEIKAEWEAAVKRGDWNKAETQIWLADKIAENAHHGEIRFSDGGPYIRHPRAVASKFDPVKETNQHILSLLHDVGEVKKGVPEEEWSLKEISNFSFNAQIISGMNAITRRDGENYIDYIHRVSLNRLVSPVKVGDINHNRATEVINSESRLQKDQLHMAARLYLLRCIEQKISPKEIHFREFIRDRFQPEMAEVLELRAAA